MQECALAGPSEDPFVLNSEQMPDRIIMRDAMDSLKDQFQRATSDTESDSGNDHADSDSGSDSDKSNSNSNEDLEKKFARQFRHHRRTLKSKNVPWAHTSLYRGARNAANRLTAR